MYSGFRADLETLSPACTPPPPPPTPPCRSLQGLVSKTMASDWVRALGAVGRMVQTRHSGTYLTQPLPAQ